MEDELKKIVQEFIKENKITCPETIYQANWVIENAYDFIQELCDKVGYISDKEAYPEDYYDDDE